jgi:SAM-dependent methyltransferase
MNPVDLYLSVREKEGRLYPDDLAARLPDLPPEHPLSGEWRARAASCEWLKRYLARSSQPLAILELGCGNGWLSNQLAGIPSTWVCGLDRNPLELAQAVRLFAGSNLVFLEADISSLPFSLRSFDVILLASVIQYIADLPALILRLKPLLKPGGEIHLLDSPLYRPGELLSARQRSRSYYASLGIPEMAGHYFHHPVSALEPFSAHWLYRPDSLKARLARRFGEAVSPFPWVCLR